MHQLSRLARAGWIIAALGGMLLPASGFAAEIKPLPPDERAYGLTLTEWATAWFQWSNSLPSTGHPSTDSTGVQSGKGQRLPVWFLPVTPASLRSATNRTIFIPEGYAILCPGPFYFSAGRNPGEHRDEEWHAEVQASSDAWVRGITKHQWSLNGAPVGDWQLYRVRTPIFGLVISPGNVMSWPAEPGKDNRVTAIGDGYFFLLPPLPAGKHVLQLERQGVSPTTAKPYAVSDRYNLIIQEPNKAVE